MCSSKTSIKRKKNSEQSRRLTNLTLTVTMTCLRIKPIPERWKERVLIIACSHLANGHNLKADAIAPRKYSKLTNISANTLPLQVRKTWKLKSHSSEFIVDLKC